MHQIVHGRVIGGRHKAPEEGLQIPLHVRIGILLHQQRTGGVLAEQGQQAIALSGHEGCRIAGELIKAGTARRNRELGLHRFRIPVHLAPGNRQMTLRGDGSRCALYPNIYLD